MYNIYQVTVLAGIFRSVQRLGYMLD